MKDVINAFKLFNQIDLNADWNITKEELYLGLKQRLNSDFFERRCKKYFLKI